MIGYVHSLQFARISLRRVNEVILEEQAEKFGGLGMPTDKSIRITNLNFKYNPNLNNVLNNVSIEIPEGKITAIVGESGSGKTTLMKLLLRFYEFNDGNIYIGQVPIENIDLYLWRNQCGAVLQDGKVFNDTILYNITLEDNEDSIDNIRLQEAVKLSNIDEFINDRPQKLYTPLGTNGIGLSQGQKQRILIARAIYKDPDFIFLDEATNSLDANNEREISRNLEQILKGKTAILIAHRLSTIKNAHNIIVLSKGQVAEQGTHNELMKQKGSYYNLIANQLTLD